ncbi:hypothetical protein AXFE_27490 [Acidithrix ferrooxidans]|uniref:Uncharacterized protein n=1 Tax=Acidithrix ferrooxidans TaxID=1280514 RepID=A0A0D8HEM6_9ACTN|nr:hypothetical protein AXFE_27490 [Acidithrix ferrooxidans]
MSSRLLRLDAALFSLEFPLQRPGWRDFSELEIYKEF